MPQTHLALYREHTLNAKNIIRTNVWFWINIKSDYSLNNKHVIANCNHIQRTIFIIHYFIIRNCTIRMTKVFFFLYLFFPQIYCFGWKTWQYCCQCYWGRKCIFWWNLVAFRRYLVAFRPKTIEFMDLCSLLNARCAKWSCLAIFVSFLIISQSLHYCELN